MNALPNPLSETDVRRLSQALHARRVRRLGSGTGAPSAVLAALFEAHGDIHVWLMRREASLRSHAGQVALPGGKHEPHDHDLWATALRESEEEIGLPASAVFRLGPLDEVVTGTGFIITPYVAWLEHPFVPRPDPREVARIFAAPLRTFAAPPTGTFPRIGVHVDDEFVWGATFAILRNLCEILGENAGPAAPSDASEVP